MTDQRHTTGRKSLTELGRLRESKGWTVREAARRAGCSHNAVHGAEQGKHYPSDNLVASLARIYSMNPKAVRAMARRARLVWLEAEKLRITA